MNQTYSCDRCETILTETTQIIYCECGYMWCSEACAFEDGFQYGVQLDGFGRPCHVLEGATCGYCRPDKCDDTALLNHALDLLNLTKAQLIESLKTKRETNEGDDYEENDRLRSY